MVYHCQQCSNGHQSFYFSDLTMDKQTIYFEVLDGNKHPLVPRRTSSQRYPKYAIPLTYPQEV